MNEYAEIQKSGRCAVKYNPTGREWLVARPTGQTIAFPAGAEGKRAAMLSALTHDAPDVAAWVETLMNRYPDNQAWINRVLRAGFLVRDKMVFAPLNNEPGSFLGEVARVKSRRTGEYYPVVKKPSPLGWFCDCRDYINTRLHLVTNEHQPSDAPIFGGQIYCKHIIATYIALRVAYTLKRIPRE